MLRINPAPETKFIIAIAVEDSAIHAAFGLASIAGFLEHKTAKFDVAVCSERQLKRQLREILSVEGLPPPSDVAAVFVSTFGIVDSEACMVRDIPRPEWQSSGQTGRKPAMDLAKIFEELGYRRTQVCVANDATAAAYGEYCYRRPRREQRSTDFAYVRIGRGVNAGMVLKGATWQGAMHPEMGHIRPRPMAGDTFRGTCKRHIACLEGLISEAALSARFGDDFRDRKPSHRVWKLLAHYVAELCATLVCVLALREISIGGTLIEPRPWIIPMVQRRLVSLLEQYPSIEVALNPVALTVAEASLRGALELGREAAFRGIPRLDIVRN